MKKLVFIVLTIALAGYLAGCGGKEEAFDELQEPMPIEQMGSGAEVAAPQLEPLPPSGPYSPTAKEIQLALKNAGLYTGSIDGKIGPQTKKAIEEFQRANSLTVDGKVGIKTWAVLSKYLTPAATEIRE